MKTQKQLNPTPEHINAAREQRIAKISGTPEKVAIQGLENSDYSAPAIQGLNAKGWPEITPAWPEITPEQYAFHAGISVAEAEKVLKEAENRHT